ncbi:MSMEG_0570 family nitrogen starvation response protein [Epibacterium ulvae]|uniref:MSMEG_0570 family nitrogen starvation response protein n=1 Tax=Epibacterium ulvae TaxID=1156985 RepID=UPI001BFCB4E1|nr:MSMEG_0570 family nitrogen starvation response protein [Epibacterium ulvae]MBT8154749.1 MSMEG_0570 family nitrogen starvation response protein [Epibacterium ulvae]
MPEMRFTVRWPDGQEEICYSPSSVVTEFLAPATTYTLGDFVIRSRLALDKASGRVAAIYGYRCSRAEAQLDRIEARAKEFEDSAEVQCLRIG